MHEIVKNDRGLSVLAGTNRKVFRVIIWHKTGMASQDMIDDLDLTLGQLVACLRYYDANRQEIDDLIAKDNLDYESSLQAKVEEINKLEKLGINFDNIHFGWAAYKKAWQELSEHFKKVENEGENND